MPYYHKTVFIMRGVPGSGKSSVARRLAQSLPGANFAIHSTDDLCMVDGEYQFDVELAPARHAQNLENFKESLEKGVLSVIVDNTNVKHSQYAPYVEAAQAAGYGVAFVELTHPDLDVAAERNTHGVPREVINQMMLDWEPSQHSATVAGLMEAARVVDVLQARERVAVWVGVALGSLVGSFLVALAWLIWP